MSEREGYREAMGRMTERIIKQGVPPKQAETMARESIRRIERSNTEKGK